MSFTLRIILTFVLIFLVEFYFYKKFFNSIKNLFPAAAWKKNNKLYFLIIILFNLYPLFLLGLLIYSSITGVRFDQPDGSWFDYFIRFPFWIITLTIIQSLIYFLILDLLKLILIPVYKKHKQKWLSIQYKIILVMVIGFFIYVPIRILYDFNNISVRITEYKNKSLPEQLDGFKLTFISDMQADEYTDSERLENFIGKVNSTKPDLVLMAGDVITGSPKYIDTAAKFLGRIKSKYGVLSCVGDHDNWAYRDDYSRSLGEITTALKKEGIKMIDNGRDSVIVNGAEIAVTFVTNTYVSRVPPEILDNLVNRNGEGELKIFLTHQPKPYLVDKALEFNYDLFLAGHTHGGQITFVFPFITLSPTLFETKYVRGDFHLNDLMVIVNRGLGMSILPLRYNSTPEVTVIILRKENP